MPTEPDTQTPRPATRTRFAWHARAAAAGRRTRLAWYAYDLGNTTVEFAIPLYLTIWIVQDIGVPAWLFGLASAFSSWAIGLSGPYIGVRADERRERRRWFTASALVAAVLLGSLAALPTEGFTSVTLILCLLVLANYFFQLSSLIYNASMLTAARGANVVSVSALGIALSYLGGLAGIVLIELLVSGSLIPGLSGRAYAVLPMALLFLACALPSFGARGLWQSAPTRRPPLVGHMHRRIQAVWREASRQHKAGWFLAGFFALNSSIMGITLYLPLHVTEVTDLHDSLLTIVLGGAVIVSAVGAGAVTLLHPVGPTVRQIVLLGLTLLGLNALVLSLVSGTAPVIAFVCLHGLLSGALVPTVRAAFAQTFRSEYQALGFGLFGAVQRVSQGLGAALWPLATVVGGTATSVGIGAMAVLALLGVPFFIRWRLPDPTCTTVSEQS